MRRRRLPTVLSALAGSALLALTVTGSARAAAGVLVIDGVLYEDPSGCLESEDRGLLDLVNGTDQPATVYVEAGCAGISLGEVAPGASGQLPGTSVLIA